ncbi:MAG: hypothetical protein RMM53_01570 [Bacteroidia bacterium]|nr:hypothetical protein [Bacteroidia bacterium]
MRRDRHGFQIVVVVVFDGAGAVFADLPAKPGDNRPIFERSTGL